MKKKFDLRKIMTRAWTLVKTVGVSISSALKTAWKESKDMLNKIKFNGSAKIVIEEGYSDDVASKYLYFNEWIRSGKHRIYLNDYKRRTIGYIDCDDGNKIIIKDFHGAGEEKVKSAINEFFETYCLTDASAEEVQKVKVIGTHLDYDDIDGLRIYVSGDTRPIKKGLQLLGFSWDRVAHEWFKEIAAVIPKEVIAETKKINESLKQLAETIQFDVKNSNVKLRAYKEALTQGSY